MSKNFNGFTLIELLVTISIISILAAIGMVAFGVAIKSARDGERKSDVNSILKALEANYNPTNAQYPTSLQGAWFASGQPPTPPEGGSYTVSYSSGNTGVRVCATLENATLFCKDSTQGVYIASGSPSPSGSPASSPSPSPLPTPTVAPSVTADTAGFRAYMSGIEASLRSQADTIEYGGTPPPPGSGNSHVVYPGPSGITASDQYTARISNTSPIAFDNSFVYKSIGTTYVEQDTSWTSFSFSGSILVEVAKVGTPVTTCAIRPNKFAITPTVASNRCYFTLTAPANVSVEINGDLAHPMLVFANSMEINPPSGPSANVVYFGPGVHNIGGNYSVQSNQTIYLAGGAYLKGTFLGNGIQNVVIRGRGVLSGEQFAPGGNGLIKVENTGITNSNIVVDGITLVNSPFYNIDLQANRATVRNTKMIAWEWSTDGIGCHSNCLIENNFIKVNDDSTRAYLSNTIVTNNVIWQLVNGAPFQLSWNVSGNRSNFYMHDNIVLRAEHQFDQPNDAIFGAYHAGTATLSNYLFENINIEDVNWRVFYLSVQQNGFAPPPCCLGRVTDVVFNNITADKPMQLTSWVFGYDATHGVDHVIFNKLKINGTLITPANQGTYFYISPTTTNNITFTNNPL